MYISFLKAGTYQDYENVIFFSKHRQAAKLKGVYHNNDKTSIYKIPKDFYKTHFTFNSKTGFYENSLTYKDIKQFLTIIDHTKK